MSEFVPGMTDPGVLRESEFWALDDVSFELRRGEVLGLLGRNGAGKTTLLRLIAGLLKPDHGRIDVRGQVGALIALGAGFHPRLTGRENIYINGAVLGLSRRQIDARLDEIIAFAELEEFIDTPVQSYSSGMRVRLGFSIATALSPDVLLLDEVLAVGDARFRMKCYRRVGELVKDAAVVYVGHDLNQLGKLCSRVLVMEHGKICFDGPPAKAISFYLDRDVSDHERVREIEVFAPDLSEPTFELLEDRLSTWDRLQLAISIESAGESRSVVVRCGITTRVNELVAEYESSASGHDFQLEPGVNRLEVDLGPVNLSTGRYLMSTTIYCAESGATLVHGLGVAELFVEGRFGTTAKVELGVGREHP